MLNLKGSTITIDALGCQSDILESIIDKGGDYVVALKNNHKKLYKEVQELFSSIDNDQSDIKISEHTTNDKAHARTEKRVCRAINVDDCEEHFNNLEKFSSVKTIIEVESTRIVNNNETICKRYYISSLILTAEKALEIIRSHWCIENKLHWILDVTFKEDESRIRKGNAPENLATVIKLAYNILSKYNASKNFNG